MSKRNEQKIDKWIAKQKKGLRFTSSDYQKEIGVESTFIGRYLSWNPEKVKDTGQKDNKGIIWEILLISIVLLCGSAQGFTLENVNITPDYNVLAGDQITASFTLIPAPFGEYTSNPNTTIQILTTLQDPIITRRTIINGYLTVQNIQSSTLNLEGWDIAYRSGEIASEYFNITISGKAPTNPTTGQAILFDVSEYAHGVIVSSSRQSFSKLVISQNDLQSGIFLASKDLETLKKNIDEKKKIGIDTSSEQSIYDNSVNSITLIKSYPPNQYPLALERLRETNTAIKTAQDLLDRSWAVMELKNATVPLAQLDATIATLNRDITNNTGITRFLITNKTESELRLIVFNRTQAFTHISNANRALNDKQYATVRSESQKAGAIIESTTNTAKALQKRNSDPLTIVYENWIIFAVIGLIAILVLLFKPKRRRKKKVKKMDVKP